MDISSLHSIILVKLCWYAFVALGLVGIYRRWNTRTWLLLIGGLSGLAYFFLVRGTILPFWGLSADEITIAAMYEMFAHGSFFSDFSYATLPPFYPPLFFWVFAIPGRLFDWNGVQMMKAGALSVMVVFPVLFATIQNRWWNVWGEEKETRLAVYISAVVLPIVIGWDAVITKPYEMVSAALTVVWGVYVALFLNRISVQNAPFKKHLRTLLLFSITGAVLFLMFYFWFFLVAIGLSLFFLFTKYEHKVKTYRWLIGIGVGVLLLSTIFWLKLAKSYHLFGSENWQLGFLTGEWLNTSVPFFAVSVVGMFLLIGLVSLLWYRSQLYIRALGSLFVAGYIWQLMGYVTIGIFSSPLQESKGFHFYHRSILVLAAAYAIAKAWTVLLDRFPVVSKHVTTLLSLLLLLVSVQLPFGKFADDVAVRAVHNRSRAYTKEDADLIMFLREKDVFHSVSLEANIPILHAFLPLNTFVYFNQHNSHPAALFSERFLVVRDMERARTPEELYRIVQENSIQGIDRLILYRASGESFYPLYFHVDNFPNEFREEEIRIPKSLITDEFFITVFESEHYIIFEPKEV